MKVTTTSNGTTRPQVYGLARVSSAEQAREGKAGMQRQRDAIAQIAGQYGLDVIEVIEAPDVRGREIAQHPAVSGMIRALESGAIDGVVVAEFSRLVRPEDMDFGLAATIKRARRLVWDSSGVLDANTSSGYWMSLLKGGMAGAEIGLMRDRMAGAKEVMRRAGENPLGDNTLPKIGLRYHRVRHGHGYWEYTPEAELIRQAYGMLLAKATYADIGRMLGGRYKTLNGIRILLRNRCWLGVRSYTTKKDCQSPEVLSRRTGKTYRAMRARTEDELLEVPMRGEDGKPLEPLIPVAQWKRAQEIIASRLGLWRSKQPSREQMVAARTLRCSCGAVMYHRPAGTVKTSHAAYYCSTRHFTQRAKGIEPCGAETFRRDHFEATLARIVDEALKPRFLYDAFRRMKGSRPKAPGDAKRIRAMIDNLRARETRLVEMRLDGGIPYEDFKTRKATLVQQIRALEESLPVELPLPDMYPALEALARAVTSFPSWTPDEKRLWYARAITSIVIEDRIVTSLRINGGFLAGYANRTPDKLLSHSCTPSSFVGAADLELTGRWQVAA